MTDPSDPLSANLEGCLVAGPRFAVRTDLEREFVAETVAETVPVLLETALFVEDG